jgi:hypothetical protein
VKPIVSPKPGKALNFFCAINARLSASALQYWVSAVQ